MLGNWRTCKGFQRSNSDSWTDALRRQRPGYEALGHTDARTVLERPITDAAEIAAWTDFIFQCRTAAAGSHGHRRPAESGRLPPLPKPIVDIDHFRREDFHLFVTDQAGLPAVVVPVKPHGSGEVASGCSLRIRTGLMPRAYCSKRGRLDAIPRATWSAWGCQDQMPTAHLMSTQATFYRPTIYSRDRPSRGSSDDEDTEGAHMVAKPQPIGHYPE